MERWGPGKRGFAIVPQPVVYIRYYEVFFHSSHLVCRKIPGRRYCYSHFADEETEVSEILVDQGLEPRFSDTYHSALQNLDTSFWLLSTVIYVPCLFQNVMPYI